MNTTEAQATLIANDVKSKLTMAINWSTIITIVTDLLEAAVVCLPLLATGGQSPTQYIASQFDDQGDPNPKTVERLNVKVFHASRRLGVQIPESDREVFSTCTLNRTKAMSAETIDAIIQECSP